METARLTARLEVIAEREYQAHLAKYPKIELFVKSNKAISDICQMLYWSGFAKGQELAIEEVKNVLNVE